MRDKRLNVNWEQYWEAVQKYWSILAGLSLGVGIVTYLIVSQIGVAHTIHFSYIVSLSEREDANEYRFDGYYALQATSLFTETLTQIIQSPEVITSAYDKGGIPYISQDPREVVKSIDARKAAPQLVSVVIRGNDLSSIRKLSESLRTVVREQVDVYHSEGIPALRFRVVSTTPWEGRSSISPLVASVSLALFALLAGINGILLLVSLRYANRD